MEDTVAFEMEQRLARLEKQNRWMKLGGGVMLVALAAVMLMGYAMPDSKVLEAEKLLIKDEKGIVKVKLTKRYLKIYDEDGQAELTKDILRFIDEKGNKCGYDKQGLMFVDEKKRPQVAMNKNGLLFWNADMASGAMLTKNDQGFWTLNVEKLIIEDQTGKERACLERDALQFWDETGMWRARMSKLGLLVLGEWSDDKFGQDGKGFYGSNALSIGDMGVRGAGLNKDTLSFIDGDGKLRVVLGCSETVIEDPTNLETGFKQMKHPVPQLYLYNKEGKIIFKAP